MSLKYIAVQGCTLTISGVTPGTATITSSTSTKVKAGHKGVYRGTVQVQLTGCSSGTYNQTGPVTSNFTLTAQKNKADSEFVLREGDQATGISVSMVNSVYPFDSSSFTASVEVTSAGQVKVKAA
jgi:hypothetical protein